MVKALAASGSPALPNRSVLPLMGSGSDMEEGM